MQNRVQLCTLEWFLKWIVPNDALSANISNQSRLQTANDVLNDRLVGLANILSRLTVWHSAKSVKHKATLRCTAVADSSSSTCGVCTVYPIFECFHNERKKVFKPLLRFHKNKNENVQKQNDWRMPRMSVRCSDWMKLKINKSKVVNAETRWTNESMWKS